MPPKRKCECCPEAPDPSPFKYDAQLLTLIMQRKYRRDNTWPTRTGDRLADIEAGMQFLKDMFEEAHDEVKARISNVEDVVMQSADREQLYEVEKDMKEKTETVAQSLEEAEADIILLQDRLDAVEHKLKSGI